MEIFKPCPFCGGRSIQVNSLRQPYETAKDWWYTSYALCKRCNGRGPTAIGEKGQNEVPSRKLAIELWNGRVYDV